MLADQHSEDVIKWRFIEQLGATIGNGAVLGIIHALRENPETSEQLAGLVSKSFLKGGLTNRSLFESANDQLMDYYLSWSRKGETQKLLEDPKGGFKYIGVDFLVYGETQFFWPPPIVDLYNRNDELDVTTASSLWVARGVWRADSQEIITALHSFFGATAHVGVFQLCK